jgi:opacity protein-like surface antigen
MPFLTLGGAVARASVAVSDSCVCYELTPLTGGGFSAFNFSFTDSLGKSGAYMWGFTGGIGLEWALTSNIFARADYEYVQFSPVFQITSHLNLAHVGLGVKF